MIGEMMINSGTHRALSTLTPNRMLSQFRILACLFAGLAAFGAVLWFRGPAVSPPVGNRTITKRPVYFVPNVGQFDSKIKYSATGAGLGLFLTDKGAVYTLSARPKKDNAKSPQRAHRARAARQAGPAAERAKTAVLRLKFFGANPKPAISGSSRRSGKFNYLIGNDSAKWRTNVPGYGRVGYSNLYKGIDLAFRDGNGRVKYEFTVKPGADPDIIKFNYQGAKRIRLDPSGDLVIGTRYGEVRDEKPTAYQTRDGRRAPVDVAFAIKNRRVGFAIGLYDPKLPLIIDPALVYTTYLGGGDFTGGEQISVDSSGSAYITGWTTSSDYPVSGGSYDTSLSGVTDAFITKLSPSGSDIVYSTFIGGSSGEVGSDIELDSQGNAFIVGSTYSGDFPTTPGAFNETPSGSGDVFTLKLNPSGSALEYSTIVGQSWEDYEGFFIEVDSSGSAYIAGALDEANVFPTTPGAFDETYNYDGNPYNEGDIFISKIAADGSDLDYSTYFGGKKRDAVYDLAIDAGGDAFITGWTRSAASDEFSVTGGAFDTEYSGGGSSGDQDGDSYVAKLNPTGSGLEYSTYLGGTNSDVGYGITVDSSENAYVTGYTASDDFPITAGVYDETHGGGDMGWDAFASKLNSTGSGLDYSTYFGGSNDDLGHSVEVDAAGNATLFGYTYGSTLGPDFPVTPNAYSQDFDGMDHVIFRLNASGSSLVYSTFVDGIDSFPGPGMGHALGMKTRLGGQTYIVGTTATVDAVVMKFDLPPISAVSTDPAAPDGPNDWYATRPSITINPDETATSYYQWDSTASGSWTTYAGAFSVPDGERNLYFYSADTSNNTENAQTRFFKVDDTSPTAAALSGTPGSGQVELSWTASTDTLNGIGGYKIYDADTLAEITETTLTSYTITGLASSTTYRFFVKAFDGVGNFSGPSNTVTLITTSDSNGPTAPLVVGFVPGAPSPAASSIDLFWPPSADDVGVVGYRVLDGDTLSHIATVTATSFSASGLTPGTVYGYLVQAVDTANNFSSGGTAVRIAPGRGAGTPTGTNVSIHPDSDLNVVFSNVSSAGTTTVSKSTGAVAPPPVDVRFVGPQFDISTTAGHSSTITVAVKYSGAVAENTIKLWHYAGGAWQNVTAALDTGNNVVIGEGNSLSPYIAGEESSPSVGTTSSTGWFKVSASDTIGNTYWRDMPENASFSSPHGGFTSSSNLCRTCHAVHSAGQFSYRLLKSGSDNFELGPDRTQGEGSHEGAGNLRATECMYCHDASAGLTSKKPYEMIPSGKAVRGEHTLGATNVPDSNINIGSGAWGKLPNRDPVDSADSNGILQCYQCHSVHGANTIGATYNSSDGIDSWNTKILRLDPAGDGSVLAKGSGGLSVPVWESELAGNSAAVRTGFCADCHNLNPNWVISAEDSDRPNRTSHPQGPGADGLMEVYGDATVGVAMHLGEQQGCRGCHAASDGGDLPGESRFPHQSGGWKLLWDSYTTTGVTENMAASPARVVPKMDKVCLFCHPMKDIETYGGYAQVEQSACYRCHDSVNSLAYGNGAPDVQTQFAKTYVHPTQVYTGRHTDNESSDPAALLGAANRHAECLDCHDMEKIVQGSGNPNRGIWGVKPINGSAGTTPTFTLTRVRSNQYELCFKCHSAYTTRGASNYYETTIGAPISPQSDKSIEFNPNNTAFHPIEAIGRNQSITLKQQLAAAFPTELMSASGTTGNIDVTLKCTDCHNSDETSATRGRASNSGFRPKGPHGSVYRPILRANYWLGYTEASGPISYNENNFRLCFTCHTADMMTTNSVSVMRTNFSDFAGMADNKSLHYRHVVKATNDGKKVVCRNCHYNVHSNVQARNARYAWYQSGAWTSSTAPPPGVKTHLINFSPDVLPKGTNDKPMWSIWLEADGLGPVGGTRMCTLVCHGMDMAGFSYRPNVPRDDIWTY